MLPSLASPSLLDRVQNKPDVEGTLRQLRKQRLKEQWNAVYIQPQAKSGLQASDDQRFALMEKVEEFLDCNQKKVFLLLGDSGAGKSTFNRQLECELWNKYKKNTGRIPLFINLPAIDKPEQDMIAKQLRRSEFTETEIRELKVHREFILICDGYDESQQTHNLYMSNQLNQPGEWNAQMVVSCRSEYLGVDYRDRFQPGDRNSRSEPGQFQEAVITPFTQDQVQDYIKQYVSVYQPLWEAKDYEQALDLISGLKDLVRNPFLMTLSLEVLPRMVDPGEHLSVTQVTRVALYDQFIEHWLERGKKRIGEKELSSQAKAAFESLIDEGFTQNGIDFLKRLAVAIYKEQDGQPIVKYSRFKDGSSWKTEFFSREDEKQLLREACPLKRSGNQHRFIHRSLLEYGLALAIFDPNDWKETSSSMTPPGRRGSASSTFSFRIHGPTKDMTSPPEQEPDLYTPLAWRYFINEPSILQFLSERVQQETVFKQQLLSYIEHSKEDKKWRTGAANAITILVRAGVPFNSHDLQGIQIPGADLSYGLFESAQLQGADLRQVNLRGAWLHRADLSRAQMAAVQFGELPHLKVDNDVYACAYSPDGKSLALSLSNGDIKLYSTSTWEHVRTLTGHTKRVWSIAYSPDGNQIISGSSDRTVRLWDVEAGACLYTLIGHSGQVNRVAFAPCGSSVASTSVDGTVRVWDTIRTGECRLTLSGHTGSVVGIVYSPKGHLIASGGFADYVVRLWDVHTGKCLHILSGHTKSISGVAFSPRGDRIASSSLDRAVRVWDTVKVTCCRVLTGHTSGVGSVAFSPQGDAIASAGNDRAVRIWDVETGVCRHILPGHSGVVRCVVFSPEGDRIACCSEGNTLRIWDVGPGGTRHITNGHDSTVLSVKFSPCGDQVASCSYDGSIRLWDVMTGSCLRTLKGHRHWVRSIAYSPRGDLVVSGSDDRTTRLWDVKTGACRQTLTDLDGYVRVVAYSPRGDQVAFGDQGGYVRIWDLRTGMYRHMLTGHFGGISCIVYSPRGKQLASSDNHTLRLWDIESGTCLHTLIDLDHNIGVTDAVYSPRGDLLASAGNDSTVKLWNVETGECCFIFIGHTKAVGTVVYSPQGGRFVSGAQDGSMKLWDDGTGERIHNLTGHTEKVSGIAFSPKGDRIVSASGDKTIRLWSVASGQCQAVVQDLDAFIRSIAWSTTPGTNYFVTGCNYGLVRMWKVVEDSGLCYIRVHWRPVNGELNVTEASVQGVRGLSQLNKQLLQQRGAVGEPLNADHLHEASKVLSMVSVVSALEQSSSGTTLGSTFV